MIKNIAVIGTGIMGSGIAMNFLINGYKVFVWNRNKEKIKPLIQKGAIEAASPLEAASKADIIFEVTANDESSKNVWLSPAGIFAGAKKGSILITSATLSVSWIDELGKIAKDNGFTFFDMPLTGSRAGAETGTLVLLVGGNSEELEKLKPDLKAISQQIMYFGKVGSGMRYKLILNMLQAIHWAGLSEALKVAERCGLDLKVVGDALSERPGGTATNLAWKGYQNPPEKTNFSVQWITKDLEYTRELADGLGLPLLEDTLNKFKNALTKGMGEKDWTLVLKG